MTKFEGVNLETAGEDVSRMWEKVCSSRADIQVPMELYLILAHSPHVMEAWSGFAQSLRGYDSQGKKFENPLAMSGRLYHLAKLQVALSAPNPYEWVGHVRHAAKYGISDIELTALKSENLCGFIESERDLLNYTIDIVKHRDTSESLKKLERLLPPKAVVELTVTIGFYICIAKVIHALAIERSPNEK